MELPFVNKHLYLMLTDAEGERLDPIELSIQDMLFKDNGEYEVTCKAAANDDLELNLVRHGLYSVKASKNGQITLLCNEETGQFKGKYEVHFDMLKGNIGNFSSQIIKDGSSVNGVFKIAA